MNPKYFVTVIAVDRASLQRLRDYELDLFQQTAQAAVQRRTRLAATARTTDLALVEETEVTAEERQFSVDGLLSLEEIGRLVDDGYSVLVKENAAARQAAATETIGARDWYRQQGFGEMED